MQKTMAWTIGVGVVVVGLAAAGCRHGHPQSRHAGDSDADHDEHHDERHEPQRAEHHHDEPRREPALGSGISNSLAVRSIADARCEREARCGNIGADQDYADKDICEEKIRAEWNDDLNKYECPNGVVQAELDECLRDIKQEDCGNPFDSLARMISCNSGDICDD
ncbi:MAG: DUF6184 family natural product biosynthesis lipoprotein [Myxococcales bacterium]